MVWLNFIMRMFETFKSYARSGRRGTIKIKIDFRKSKRKYLWMICTKFSTTIWINHVGFPLPLVILSRSSVYVLNAICIWNVKVYKLWMSHSCNRWDRPKHLIFIFCLHFDLIPKVTSNDNPLLHYIALTNMIFSGAHDYDFDFDFVRMWFSYVCGWLIKQMRSSEMNDLILAKSLITEHHLTIFPFFHFTGNVHISPIIIVIIQMKKKKPVRWKNAHFFFKVNRFVQKHAHRPFKLRFANYCYPSLYILQLNKRFVFIVNPKWNAIFHFRNEQ